MKKIYVSLFVSLLALISGGCEGTYSEAPTNFPTTLKPTSPTDIPVIVSPEISFSQLPNSILVAVAGKDYGSLFLVNLDAGVHHKLMIPGKVGINIHGWSKDGCTLIVGTDTNHLIRIDVNGHIKEEILNINNINFDGKIILTSISISPDEQWIAFISGTGHQEYSTYEFQNLVTVPVYRQNNHIYQLTDRGLVSDFSWKPDGSFIAYVDVDTSNIQQVFTSEPDGSKLKQLTHFTLEDLKIKSLLWSPTGERIAIAIMEETTGVNYLVVMDANLDEKKIPVQLQLMEETIEYWWTQNDIIVVKAPTTDNGLNTLASKTLSWYSGTTGEKLGELDLMLLSNQVIMLPGPLTNSGKVGFFSDHSFYIYDIFSLHIEKKFNQFADMRYWISSPSIYQGYRCN